MRSREGVLYRNKCVLLECCATLHVKISLYSSCDTAPPSMAFTLALRMASEADMSVSCELMVLNHTIALDSWLESELDKLIEV